MSKIPRLYLESTDFHTETVSLQREARHYLTRVLRLRRGDRFCAMDGQGKAWTCTLTSETEGRFLEEFPALPNPDLKLTVAVALCKGERFENTIEKLAELGVARLVPLHTERTERGEPSASKFDRWRQISKSASALAYRLYPMIVEETKELAQLVRAQAEPLLFCHPGGRHPAEVFASKRASATIAIGPEGGFSPVEVTLLSESAGMMGLGAFNLRVETAAVVAAGLALQLATAKETTDPVST